MTKTLLDSNIIIYALNSNSPKHSVARQFIERTPHLVVTHQNFLETFRILTHPKFSHPQHGAVVLDLLAPLRESLQVLDPTSSTLYHLDLLILKYNLTSNRIFDGYLAATALSHDVTQIATDNEKDFSFIDELEVVNPFK